MVDAKGFESQISFNIKVVMILRCFHLKREALLCFYCFFIILIFLPATICIVPDASQEGALHAFKSYSDVTMLHFNVPKQVSRATWQFAAFMDNQNCPQREVHIHLRHGSYPVIFSNNETFPMNMYLKDSDTIKISTFTSFEPKVATIIPVYGPKSGDWFIAAYLSYWDEKIQQQGLRHECHYGIGSIALWNKINDIQNIPIGDQVTLETKKAASYYKIYVPSGISMIRVQIWGCNFMLYASKHINEPCIKYVVLQGRILPVYEHVHSNSIGNLTILDSHTFTVSFPYEDNYYYLLVISESAVKFNVQISMSECPIELMQKPFMQYTDTSLFSKTLMQISRNITSSYDTVDLKMNETRVLIEDYAVQNKCFPRYQLVRVKHSQLFSGIYMLQGKDWLTPWIALTDLHPVTVQFDILPLVDIGGTLAINVHLEMYESQTKQLVSVTVCVQPSQAPDIVNEQIVCHDKELSMNLLSTGKHDSSILIPFPQADTWYIALQARCYVDSYPVECEMQQILVLLDIHTRQCVFSGNYPCSHNGVCQEIHKGLLSYTSCNCYKGYTGWACTKPITNNPELFMVVTILTLTLSNSFFIPAICIAVKRKLYTVSLVYLTTMLSSSLYHACDQRVMDYCIAEYEVLQYSDFFSSILAFWVTLVAMAELPTHFISVCHMFGVFMIAFGIQSNRTGLINILVPLIIGAMIPIGTYVYRSYHLKKWKKPKNLPKVLFGLLMAGLGLFLFSLVETEANYEYVHSAWHVIIAVSLIFLLPPKQTHETYKSSTNIFTSSSDLFDYQDFPDSPVFTLVTNKK